MVRFLLSWARLQVNSCIAAYFKNLHSIYPFLDQQDFKNCALGPDLPDLLNANPAFSALYHTVLALGCQYHEGGAWEPGKGKAWKLFQVALGLIADILLLQDQLLGVQVSFLVQMKSLKACLTNKIGSCRYGALTLFAQLTLKTQSTDSWASTVDICHEYMLPSD